MPLTIPDKLPAIKILEEENIFVMRKTTAIHQDIRPLKIVILNLMPVKITTETHILRLLSNTPLQVEVTLLHTSVHIFRGIRLLTICKHSIKLSGRSEIINLTG